MSKIELDVRYNQPIHRVWRALTDSRRLGEWLMENDFVPRVGHTFEFRMPARQGFAGVVRCEIRELEAPHLLGFSWTTDEISTYLRFTLVPDGDDATILKLEHSGFEGSEGERLRGMLENGWRTRLLRELLPKTLSDIATAESVGRHG